MLSLAPRSRPRPPRPRRPPRPPQMLSLSLLLPLLQQASGINTVIYYSSLVRGGTGLCQPRSV